MKEVSLLLITISSPESIFEVSKSPLIKLSWIFFEISSCSIFSLPILLFKIQIPLSKSSKVQLLTHS